MNTEILQPTSIMALIDTNKESRQAFIRASIANLKDGGADPLLFHIHVKNMESMLKDLTGNREYKDLVHEAAVPYGKSFERHNAKVEIKEAGTKWNYDRCEDETYNALRAQLDEIKGKMAEREKFLQNVPEGGICDPEHGNMIYRASKSSSTTVAITLK
jgi:hypothetical protein